MPIIMCLKGTIRIPNRRQSIFPLFISLFDTRFGFSWVPGAVQFAVVGYVLTQFVQKGHFVADCVAGGQGEQGEKE
jgi:hypothetical protein